MCNREECPYKMEELIPIVAELSEIYTSRESTSITFDKAKQLMEAVVYCIREAVQAEGSKDGLYDPDNALEPGVVYKKGYEQVIQKVKRAKEGYNEMIVNFQAYGNQNYKDTVVKGMPAFFLYYDVRFNPQNHILTLDYPVLRRFDTESGIDLIEQYLQCIRYEQMFLRAYPYDYIIEVLSAYHEDYENLFCNICNLVVRNILGCMMVRKPVTRKGFTTEEIRQMEEIVRQHTKNELMKYLASLLKVLVDQAYEGDEGLYEYLKEDIEDFCVELQNAAKYHCLEKIIVI